MAQQASTIFMARLAVMAPDRLAALFEAYPANSDNATLCRLYYLVVLNAKGRLVSFTQLVDPLLAECNHPHPFGLASDTRGNLYVAFSETVNSGAPLMPGAPTLVLAYSSDGVELWRRTLPMNGGELGTVRGLLLPENASKALRTQDGAEVGTLPVLGRAVATREVVVPSPAGTSVNSDATPVISTELHGFTVPGLDAGVDVPAPGRTELHHEGAAAGGHGAGRDGPGGDAGCSPSWRTATRPRCWE